MAGFFRFDFYCRDWFLDTRDLSQAAKGIFVDLLAAIYARGGPLPDDEQELCRLCGCATVRSLRPLLSELIAKAKIRRVDGHLTNGRAMEEIAKAEHRQAVAGKGGQAKSRRVPAEFEPNSSGTQPETRPDIMQNQRGSVCLSPSPSPYSTGEAKASPAAGAAFDPEKPVFDLGKKILGKSAGGQIRKLIRHHAGDLAATMQTLEKAERKSDGREYVAAILAGHRQPETDWDAEYRRMGLSL